MQLADVVPRLHALNRFPAVLRDLAVVVPESSRPRTSGR